MSEYRVGIIGGSGLYHIEGFTRQKWVKVKTPFGDPSDEFLTGELAGRQVVFLPRHGRGHRILPSELNYRANIWGMKKLGVEWIISVSAVGSLQAKYRPCDIVLPDQFVDRTKQSGAHTYFGRGIVAHIAFAHPICEELRQLLLKTARKLKARVVIDPELIDELADTMANDPSLDMATAANPLDPADPAVRDPNVVKVVTALDGRALYFSRSPLPFFRNPVEGLPVLRHKGIYAYSRSFLERFVTWPPSPLEKAESLEQLRALENGASIKVLRTNDTSPGVDTPEQALEIERLLTSH